MISDIQQGLCGTKLVVLQRCDGIIENAAGDVPLDTIDGVQIGSNHEMQLRRDD